MKATLQWAALALIIAGAYLSPVRAAPPAAAPADAYLGLLAGSWDFTGTLLGKPVRYRGAGRWVLANGWLRLSLLDVARPPAYRAEVYLGFDAKAGDYIAHWLDQFGAAGARVVATGKRAGQKLVLLFPYPEGAFRDTFELSQDGSGGSLLIESQDKDGHWSTFASYTLTRAR
ncbi:MAG: hypothetical protein ACLPQ6_11585 [Steroidobacteraceae bacterium]